ncbi:MAG: hypothetical protein NC402_07905 [Prevotella sp.]|nr:hypothetical protein [Prevotella sp.]MCM1075666.1 hypothetical protein [Ruminococcus sp.]
MPGIKIAGVMRAGAYSPNHIGNDANIFNATAEQLRRRGYVVNIYSEEQFRKGIMGEPVILNMCREAASIGLLQKYEDEGKLVINSGYGIENSTRERMTRILISHDIPYPDSIMVNTNEAVISELKRAGIEACWVKRGDFHAMHKEDVSYCRHPQEAQDVLQEYFYRGINRAVINRHLEGDLVKFYGIQGTGFFYSFYPYFGHNEKFGLDAINGKPHGVPYDKEALHAICEKAADLLDVVIYGGDCIIAEDGSFQIIDFNDWPSFAPCRKEASVQIARAVIARIKKFFK